MLKQIQQVLRDWNLPLFTWNLIILASAVIFGFILKFILSLVVRKKAEQTGNFRFLRSFFAHTGTPLNYFLPLFFLNFLLPLMQMPELALNRLGKIIEIAIIITFAWFLIRSISVAQDYVYHRFDLKKENNLRERKIRTQLLYIRQVITGIIILLTVAAILLSFSTLRRLGTGLLTGVGIGGIVIGFAAQRSLANLLAGFQIAFTQPLRIDDVLVVEGEFGRVEEITLTYVVLHLWDDRRLILPITYFIEKPFQNWTRTGSAITASVFLYADYSLPIDVMRQEAKRLVHNHPLWDGRVFAVHVTDATRESLQIRIIMSAHDSGQAWDLRCFVRENIIKFISNNYPQSLPRTRADVQQMDQLQQG